jgi:hypothetical protein
MMRAEKPGGHGERCVAVGLGLGLGGSEANPHNFQPFGGFSDDTVVEDGHIRPPDAPGIGFETRSELLGLFRSLL